MNNFREFIEDELSRMAIGQEIWFEPWIFSQAFPCGWPSIYRTPREAFLSSRVGSAWGCWTCEEERRGALRVGRHKGDETRRVYCDPDREDWFDRLPSGELVPKKGGGSL